MRPKISIRVLIFINFAHISLLFCEHKQVLNLFFAKMIILFVLLSVTMTICTLSRIPFLTENRPV